MLKMNKINKITNEKKTRDILMYITCFLAVSDLFSTFVDINLDRKDDLASTSSLKKVVYCKWHTIRMFDVPEPPSLIIYY